MSGNTEAPVNELSAPEDRRIAELLAARAPAIESGLAARARDLPSMIDRPSRPGLRAGSAWERRAPVAGAGGEVAILIPAYDPPPGLTEFVRALLKAGVLSVIVVNDGSSPAYERVFSDLTRLRRVTVLRHAINLGKGAALKTGINHILTQRPEAAGVVTADADGQHGVDDVLRLRDALLRARGDARRTTGPAGSHGLILGVRRFDGPVPLRSRFGNLLTRYVFWFFAGLRVQDTQTGLRAIPAGLLPELLRIRACGYEFETEMLIRARQLGASIEQVPIRTVYLDGNRSSHFDPLRDSMRIYFVFLRFTGSSLVTTAVDYVVFLAAYAAAGSILLGLIAARSVAVILNYLLVSRVVFRTRNVRRTLPRYLLLVVGLMLMSYGLIHALHEAVGLPVVAAKIVAETALYFFNFAVQRSLVFGRRGPARIANPPAFSQNCTAH